MIISEGLAYFLKTTGIVDTISDTKNFFIPDDDFERFQSGQLMIPMIKHLSKVSPEPVYSLETLKNVKGSSAKIYNWKVIFKALNQLDVKIEADSKSMIISGDKEIIVELLENIYKQYLKLSSPPKVKGRKPKLGADGALYIESLDPRRSLQETGSCLEFLIISFCQSFDLVPKKAAGLLTQGNKYLAHVIVKGLRGETSPIHLWYDSLISNIDKLSTLIQYEIPKGSINLILSALKPGLLSKNLLTVEKTAHIVALIYQKFNNQLDILWDWINKDGIEAFVIALKRFSDSIGDNASKIFLVFGIEQFFDIVTDKIKKFFETSADYLKALQSFYSQFSKNPEKFVKSGVLDFYLNYFIRDTESLKIEDANGKVSFNVSRIYSLCLLWVDFYDEINEYSNEILAEIKRNMKQKSVYPKFMVIGSLFYLLESFYNMKKSVAARILKTLIFLLMENYENEHLREYILWNFIYLIDQIETLPVYSILDPLIKQIAYIKTVRFNVFDYDFFISASRHQRLTVENVVLMIDLLSKVYLNDLLYSKASIIPLVYLTGMYLTKVPVLEYSIKFSEISIGMITASEILKKNQEKTDKKGNYLIATRFLKSSDTETSRDDGYKRNLILDLLVRLIQLSDEDYNQSITKILLENNGKIKQITEANYKPFETVLGLLGNTEELIKEFESNAIIVYKNPQEIESQIPLYKPPPITGRAAEDIEKIRNNRLLAIQNKIKSEEILKKKQQKLLENASKDIQKIKKNYEKVGIIDSPADIDTQNSLEYFDLALEPKNEVVLITKISKKYSLPIKILFKKYKKGNPRSSTENFNEDIITDIEIMNFLKSEGVIPNLIQKKEAVWVIKETFKKECTPDPDPIQFDRKKFISVLVQLSGNVYRNDRTLQLMPLAMGYYNLIMFFKSKEKNPKIYDEPNLGLADKDLINYLNLMLTKDPDYSLPPSIKKSFEYEFKVFYKVPKNLTFNKSQRACLEVLDGIVFEKFNFHVLMPQIAVENKLVARGINKITKKTPVFPGFYPAAPEIKCWILKLTDKYPMELLLETGKVVEDLIFTVSSGKSELQTQFPINSNPIINNYTKKKENEIYENAKKEEKAEKLRKKRKMELNEYLKQRKIEIEEKEKEELRIREEIKEQENKRLMEAEEKKRKETFEKRKKIEEWKNQKTEQEKLKESIKKMEKLNQLKQIKSSSAVLLPKIKKSESKDNLKTKNKITEDLFNTNSSKKKKNADNLNKILLESKKKQEEALKKKTQFIEYYSRNDVKSVLEEYSKTIEALHQFYLKISIKNPSEVPIGLAMKGFNKLCVDYSIVPTLLSSNSLIQYLNTITKQKSKYLDIPNFKETLAEISFITSEKLREVLSLGDPEETLTGLFRYMNLTPDIKKSSQVIQSKLHN